MAYNSAIPEMGWGLNLDTPTQIGLCVSWVFVETNCDWLFRWLDRRMIIDNNIHYYYYDIIWAPKVMKRSQRWNTLQICPRHKIQTRVVVTCGSTHCQLDSGGASVRPRKYWNRLVRGVIMDCQNK